MTEFNMLTSKNRLTRKVQDLVKANFSNSEFAEIFGIDYHNACAYISGRKAFPVSLAFRVLDYLEANLVIFRTK